MPDAPFPSKMPNIKEELTEFKGSIQGDFTCRTHTNFLCKTIKGAFYSLYVCPMNALGNDGGGPENRGYPFWQLDLASRSRWSGQEYPA